MVLRECLMMIAAQEGSTVLLPVGISVSSMLSAAGSVPGKCQADFYDSHKRHIKGMFRGFSVYV